MLRIGLPSPRSRLYPKTVSLLGLKEKLNCRKLVLRTRSWHIFFLRPWDLPKLVEVGYLEAAICGFDTILELNARVNVIERFTDFSSDIALCTLSSVSLADASISVATEYPSITQKYLQPRFTEFEIVRIRGSAEAYAHFDGISAIVDVVESGGTLRANGLEVREIITQTYPCLICHPDWRASKRISLLKIAEEIRAAAGVGA